MIFQILFFKFGMLKLLGKVENKINGETNQKNQVVGAINALIGWVPFALAKS